VARSIMWTDAPAGVGRSEKIMPKENKPPDLGP
jgi:hypothetical protein